MCEINAEDRVEDVHQASANIGSALNAVLRSCGRAVDAERLSQLVAEDRRLLQQLSIVHDDTVPFLESLQARGVRTAFVSNCADNTRALLEATGLHSLVDELVLSCEVGVSKPDPSIYRTALEQLQVDAGQALFIDDQQVYCDGAAAVGIRPIRIDRFDGLGEASDLTSLLRHF